MWEAMKDSIQAVVNQVITAIPTLAFALLILLFGWFFARIMGGIVNKLLHAMNLDRKLVQTLGEKPFLSQSDGQPRSAEYLTGRLVYYFILLFVVVAFFNILNIPLITDPINQMLSKITTSIPNIFEAFIILALAWVIATFARIGITKGIQLSGLEEKLVRWHIEPETKPEGYPSLSKSIGNLVFYLILLFAVPPFMDALGQSTVVAPLGEMFSKAIGFLPNLVSALLILLIGWVAARVVKEILSNLLINVGADAFLDRLGVTRFMGTVRISQVFGYLAYFFILIPTVIGALDVLELRALSEPITVQLTRILNAIPSLIFAALILGAGFFIAQWLRGLLVALLTNFGFNALPEKLGFTGLTPGEGRRTFSEIGGSVFVTVVMLFVVMESFRIVGLFQLSDLTHRFILFLPKVFFALLLITAGFALGNYAKDLVSGMIRVEGDLAGLIPQATKVTIILFAGAMALQQLEIGDEIVQMAFTIIFGAVALALALAFGLGSRDLVSQYLTKRFSQGGTDSRTTQKRNE